MWLYTEKPVAPHLMVASNMATCGSACQNQNQPDHSYKTPKHHANHGTKNIYVLQYRHHPRHFVMHIRAERHDLSQSHNRLTRQSAIILPFFVTMILF